MEAVWGGGVQRLTEKAERLLKINGEDVNWRARRRREQGLANERAGWRERGRASPNVPTDSPLRSVSVFAGQFGPG